MVPTKLLEHLRSICLSLPEVTEALKWGHPTFLAGKKMFAVLDTYEGEPCIAFRVPPERWDALLEDDRFYPAPYAARHGWVCMRAGGRIDWRDVEGLLQESYRLVALKRMLAALDADETWRGR